MSYDCLTYHRGNKCLSSGDALLYKMSIQLIVSTKNMEAIEREIQLHLDTFSNIQYDGYSSKKHASLIG